MRRIFIAFGLIALLFCSVNFYAQWTVPRVVVQEVLDYGSNYPDSLIYPEDGTISFKAYITERPDYVLTEEHKFSRANMSGDFFSIRFNLGNFPSLAGAPKDWSVGEIVRVEVLHEPTGRVGVTEFEIEDRGSSPILRRGEEAIVLDYPTEEEDNKEENE